MHCFQGKRPLIGCLDPIPIKNESQGLAIQIELDFKFFWEIFGDGKKNIFCENIFSILKTRTFSQHLFFLQDRRVGEARLHKIAPYRFFHAVASQNRRLTKPSRQDFHFFHDHTCVDLINHLMITPVLNLAKSIIWSPVNMV